MGADILGMMQRCRNRDGVMGTDRHRGAARSRYFREFAWNLGHTRFIHSQPLGHDFNTIVD